MMIQIHVDIVEEDFKKLRKLSYETNASRAYHVRRAIREYIQQKQFKELLSEGYKDAAMEYERLKKLGEEKFGKTIE